MVLDKGLGLAETRDLLEVAGDYIDFIKLGFGTTVLYNPLLLAAKIELVRSFGIEVYPGGTFLEIAIARGRLAECLRQIKDVGFTAVEVSDGSLTLDQNTRMYAINLARNAGFIVLTEVGKKNPKICAGPLEMARQAAADRKAGAQWVIIEGRENGSRTWIYNSHGRLKHSVCDAFLASVGEPETIIWEAPRKAQQVEFIHRFGPDVNLGNVLPADTLALEAMRRGLRGDTISLIVDVLNPIPETITAEFRAEPRYGHAVGNTVQPPILRATEPRSG
jgi:phosphosulfolactate synthase